MYKIIDVNSIKKTVLGCINNLEEFLEFSQQFYDDYYQNIIIVGFTDTIIFVNVLESDNYGNNYITVLT